MSKSSLVFFCSILLFAIECFASVSIEKKSGKIFYDFKVEGFELADVEVEGKIVKKTILRGIEGFEGVTADDGVVETPVIRFYVDGDGPIEINPLEHQLDRFDPTILRLPHLPSVPKRAGSSRILPWTWRAEMNVLSRYPEFLIETVGIQRGVLRRLVTLFPIRWENGGVEKKITRFKIQAPQVEAKMGNEIGLIVGPHFTQSEALSQYVKRREEQGHRVYTYGVSPGESAVGIREKIQEWSDQSERQLSALILVGDVDQVPGFASGKIKGVSDHFYASIDGEYLKDIATPDLLVGRISVKTEGQLAKVLEKIRIYEEQEFRSSDWLKHASLLATNDKMFWKRAEAKHIELIQKFLTPQNYLGNFPFESTEGGDRLFAVSHGATSVQVKTQLRQGRGLVIFSGHGHPTEWDVPGMTAQDALRLNCNGAFPLVIAFACETARFTENSIAEAWFQNPLGAIASIGSMDDTYWDEDFILQSAIANAIWMDQLHQPARFLEKGISEVYRYYGGKGFAPYYWETYHLFADPLTAVIF